MRVDANETHRVHAEKKAFSFDFIKTRWIRKTNNSHQFRIETKYPRPGDRMYSGERERIEQSPFAILINFSVF